MVAKIPPARILDITWHQGIDLAKWIGGRYTRYPLPNELVERLQLNSEKPRQWLKALTNDVEEIRIIVTPPDQELGPDEAYNMVVFVIQTAAKLSTTKTINAYDRLEKWLRNRPGVSVQVRLVTPDSFTYGMMKETHHFDVDGITFGYSSGPKGAIGANM